jgi:hypothetical protein
MGIPGRSREHSVEVIASYQSPEIIRTSPITLWSLASGFLNDVLRPLEIGFVNVADGWNFDSRKLRQDSQQTGTPTSDPDYADSSNFIYCRRRTGSVGGHG